MFTFIFGAFFGNDTNTLGTAIIVNKSNTELASTITKALDEAKIFKIQNETSTDAAISKIKDSKAAVALEIPEGFGDQTANAPSSLKVFVDPSSSQADAAMSGFLESILTKVNLQVQNAREIYGITKENASTKKFNYFDFILVGLIGMALMNSSVQGVAISISKYREDKILKRITSTPLPAATFIAAEVLSRLILNFVQISLIILVGVYVFHAKLYGSIPMIYLLSLLGAVLFQAIGFAVAAVSKTASAAEGMATAVTIPMMFLAGVFFPIDSLPTVVYSVVQYLPLAPLLRVMRGVAIDGNSPLNRPSDLGIVLVWIIVMLFITAKKFRLRDE